MTNDDAIRTTLLAQVRGLSTNAEQRAARSEQQRSLVSSWVEQIRESDLLRMCVATELGGLEASMATQLAVFEEAAKIDGSLGWCVMIAAIHNAMACGYLPDEGARELFGAGVMPICAGLIMPSGVARPVEGGYEISGRWGFGSGSRAADWFVASAIIEGSDRSSGPPAIVHGFVERASVTIEDTWVVSGLRGTGSEHYCVQRAFVPARRTFAFPHAAPLRGGALFDLPVLAMVAPGHAGAALGIAARALDEVVLAAKLRVHPATRHRHSESATFVRELGRQRARLHAARLAALDGLERAERCVRDGRALSTDEWTAVRLAVTYATDVAADVVTFAYRNAGSSALFDSHPLQRCLRDIFAATQHIAATEDAYDFAGRAMTGEVAFDPLLLPRSERSTPTNRAS
ncbi:MAG: acyl-CoA dehydrogenase family protein [Polyangiales bacterium]